MGNRTALVTVTFNEKHLFPTWYNYYKKVFNDEDIYVLDDQSNDGHLDGYGFNIKQLRGAHPAGVKEVDHGFLRDRVCLQITELLGRYQRVMFVETDEIVCPNPLKYPGGLSEFLQNNHDEFVQASGYEPHDNNQALDLSKPLLRQRTHWHRNWKHYCKVVLTRTQPNYGLGFHTCWHVVEPPPDRLGPYENDDLRLIHLQVICKHLTKARWTHRNTTHTYVIDQAEAFVYGHTVSPDFPALEIPEHWRDVI